MSHSHPIDGPSEPEEMLIHQKGSGDKWGTNWRLGFLLNRCREGKVVFCVDFMSLELEFSNETQSESGCLFQLTSYKKATIYWYVCGVSLKRYLQAGEPVTRKVVKHLVTTLKIV